MLGVHHHTLLHDHPYFTLTCVTLQSSKVSSTTNKTKTHLNSGSKYTYDECHTMTKFEAMVTQCVFIHVEKPSKNTNSLCV